MKISYTKKSPAKEKLGALVVYMTEGERKPPSLLPPNLTTVIRQVLSLGEFTGKMEEAQTLFTGSSQIPRILLMGLGDKKKIDPELLRRTAGSTAQALAKMNTENAGVCLPGTAGSAAEGSLAEIFAEGLTLGAYRFETYQVKSREKKKEKAELKKLTLFDPEGKSGAKSLSIGLIRGEAACLARTLGNEPANTMTPIQMAKEARAVAKNHGLKIKVLEKAELEKLGMGMFMGVAKGSRQPPKLIVMEYRVPKAKQTLAFVGKGITFDSGGISLKPGAAMDEMKFDMCGGAAVIGAMEAIGRSRPNCNVVGIVPACENLPDGEAVKPGDILRSFSGKHVEILNTDAEGRLVLGDALAYCIRQYKPDAVVDLATLTGACVIALGHYATGAVGNNDALMEKVVEAGRQSGDIVWPLPNFPEYGKALKGKYADLQNIAGREGGAITGALFLKNFVDDVPWVHLDIAGTAWGVKNIGHIPNEGASGVGVRMLLDLAMNWSAIPASRKNS